MDAKEVLEQTKKHHFWILCAVVLVTGFAGWYMAVADLSTKTTAQIQAIGSSYSSVNGVVAIQQHPNPAIAEEVDKLIQQKQEDVYWGWYAQYQKQQDLVVWPDLGPQFNEAAKNLKYPFEKMNRGDDTLNSTVRGIYQRYMSDDLPKLAEIIESNWSYSEGLLDTAKGIPDAREGKRQLVYWEPDDQAKLVRTHFEPVTKTMPTTLQIAYAQEDYWVLSELLKIIARTNEKTAGGIESTIRTLDSIALGRTAIVDSAFQLAGVAALPPPVSTLSTGGSGGSRPMGGNMMGPMGGMQGMMPGMSSGSPGMPMGGMPTGSAGMPMPSGGSPGMPTGGMPTGSAGMPMPAGGSQPGAVGSTGGSTVPAATDDPADNRYVDSNFKALTAAQVRGALTTVPTTPEAAAMAVAKRIPVRIRVRMDQRRVADLLAECANGKLPVEVRQWRINPQGQQGQKAPGRTRRAANASAMPMPFNEGSDRDTTDSDDMEVLFELYGLVYLYNEPNATLLNMKQAPAKRGAPTAAAPVGGNKAT